MAPSTSKSKPAPEVLKKRNTVGLNAETVTNNTSTDIPGHYWGEDDPFTLEKFKKDFAVQFHKRTPYDAVFSLIHLDASLANAFRRIMLSELPHLAIENIFMLQNTSVIQDEVLAHRLGLIPLTAGIEGLNWLQWRRSKNDEREEDAATDFNTVEFEFKVKCEWADKGKERAKKGETDPQLLYENAHVYASALTYNPMGQQATYFPTPDDHPRPTNPDILVAKLRPGQEISLVAHARLGLGSDHAKYSPACTATYRLMPVIDIVRPIVGDDARKFARCFPRGVIGLDPVTAADRRSGAQEYAGLEDDEGAVKAVVKDPIRDTVSRECLRHDEFKGKVKLGRVRDHFIFSVESVGQRESEEMFLESVRVLKTKCERLRALVPDLREGG